VNPKNTLRFVGRIYIKICKSKWGGTVGGVQVFLLLLDHWLATSKWERYSFATGICPYVQFANWFRLVN